MRLTPEQWADARRLFEQGHRPRRDRRAHERYEVDILDGSIVKRTLAASTPAVTYSAADQTADFGAPQAAIDLRVYQLSAVFGRGTPREATL